MYVKKFSSFCQVLKKCTQKKIFLFLPHGVEWWSYKMRKKFNDTFSVLMWHVNVTHSWAICKSAPRSRQITMPAPHHLVFYRLDALPATQPTASKHWRQIRLLKRYHKINLSFHLKKTILFSKFASSVLWHCWLGARKSIKPGKIEWWAAGVVICLVWGADCLHMVQLTPLPSQNSIISCLI